MRLATYGLLQRKLVCCLRSTIKHLHLHLLFRMVLKLAKQFHMSTFMSSQGRLGILRKIMKYMIDVKERELKEKLDLDIKRKDRSIVILSESFIVRADYPLCLCLVESWPTVAFLLHISCLLA